MSLRATEATSAAASEKQPAETAVRVRSKTGSSAKCKASGTAQTSVKLTSSTTKAEVSKAAPKAKGNAKASVNAVMISVSNLDGDIIFGPSALQRDCLPDALEKELLATRQDQIVHLSHRDVPVTKKNKKNVFSENELLLTATFAQNDAVMISVKDSHGDIIFGPSPLQRDRLPEALERELLETRRGQSVQLSHGEGLVTPKNRKSVFSKMELLLTATFAQAFSDGERNRYLQRIMRYKRAMFGFLTDTVKFTIPMLDDPMIMLAAVTKEPWMLKQATLPIRADRDIVRRAIQGDGVTLAFASEVLRGDRELVLEALETTGMALERASQQLQADRCVVLKAVKKSGQALEFANPIFKSDRDVVFAAVRQNGCSLEFACERLQSDREVVLEAVKQHGAALLHACPAFRNDREVVLAAVASDWDPWGKGTGCALQAASETLQADREVVMAALRSDPRVLKVVIEAFKNDRDVVLQSVGQDGFALQHASVELRGDREVVLRAMQTCCKVNNDPNAPLRFASDAMKAELRDVDLPGCRKRVLCPGIDVSFLTPSSSKLRKVIVDPMA